MEEEEGEGSGGKLGKPLPRRKASERVYRAAVDGTAFALEDMESRSAEWTALHRWDFPIFKAAASHPATLLTKVTFPSLPLALQAWPSTSGPLQTVYQAFAARDLFQVFRIPHQQFFNFFHALESGYWDIPCEPVSVQ